MAESLASNCVSQLANLLKDEAVLLAGVRDQFEWVKTQHQLLQGFLKDADSRRKRGDERMETWISAMRGVAYEMEDVIDTINYMDERRHQRRGFLGFISRYSHKLGELTTLHKISSRIEQIKIKIQDISQSKDTLGIANLGESSATDESSPSLRQSSPDSDDDDIVIGFENDIKQLVSQLLDQNVKTRCVISIVGMGGLGKTTLARKVYNDPAIRQHFDTFGWVSVSQSYRGIKLLKDITKKVITGITPERLERMDEEELRKQLRDFLSGKKYLVVMDDVWTVDVWREMQRVFPDENSGSRILLTTREMEVANRARSCFPPHKLRILNDTESLELLCRKAFLPKEVIPADLKELAQTLAKRCGGLPLALVALGGLLSGKDPNYDAWWSVDQSMNWEDNGDGKECLNILGISYKDLKDTLKPCFLYIASFPEDSIISASKLLRLWIAEGFIAEGAKQTLERTARDYLDELVQRCMIQVVDRSVARGWVKSIRIHDMFRELGVSEARKDGFLHVCSGDMAVSNGDKSHRAAFHNHINVEVGVSSPRLRTLLGFNLVLKDGGAARRFLNGLNLVRVLDLEGARDLKKVPKQIGNMIHLRYLGLRRTGLKRLPCSIGHLLNLQTLDARGTGICWLPKSFWKIRTLRHVYININALLCAPISGDHKNLRTLKIEVGDTISMLDFSPEDRCIDYYATTSRKTVFGKPFIRNIVNKMLLNSERMIGIVLKNMDMLDSLTLFVLHHRNQVLENWVFGRPRRLLHLCSLRLTGPLGPERPQLHHSFLLLRQLTKLILRESMLEQDPMPVLEDLPNLRLLGLYPYSYLGESMSCSAGGFPRLQHLILFSLKNLKEWTVWVGAMPSLTHLTISDCWELRMLPEGLQHVTTLRELMLISMPGKFNERVRNEDGDKVGHITSIIFENEH